MKKKEFQTVFLKGSEIVPFISELAKLRINIFREYPYLYEGDLDYENNYLNTYLTCPESILVVILDPDKKVVGASSAIPLEFETVEIQKPFLENNIIIQDVFYFGESVLQPEYRGLGIYRQFFTKRETAAKNYGCKIAAFAVIERAFNDSRKPNNYVTLDKVWQYFGYEKHSQLCAYLNWKEIGEAIETAKPLIFWLKTL